MIKLKKLLATLGLSALLLAPAGLVQAVDVLKPGCDLPRTGNLDACQDNKAQPPGNNQIYGPNGLLTNVAKLIGWAVGAISIIFIVIGGYKYVMSSGDPNAAKSGKETVLFALMGLLVAIVAQSIVVFVLNQL